MPLVLLIKSRFLLYCLKCSLDDIAYMNDRVYNEQLRAVWKYATLVFFILELRTVFNTVHL